MIDFLLRPIRRNFGRDKIFYRAIDDMFGFVPHNIELYKLALIHKSASIVLDNGQHINNERLEFLGDAVIESVSSDYLFIEFPDKNEGFLTQMRSKMVSRQSLNGVAKRIGLDEHVITNSSNNNAQKHIFGDAFEAMMGAIYLDQGYDFVNRLLINNIFVKHLKLDTLVESETDFKSRLIEWCQKNHHSIHFHTIHDKNYSSSHPFFYSKVLIDSIEVGYGAGESKKEAEQRAAYSVSQGFNDADCTKLLDKLDNIDAHERAAQQKAQRQESRKGEEKPNDKVAVVKSEQKSLTEQETTTEQSADQQEAQPKTARRSRRTTKSKPASEQPATTEAATEAEKPIEESEAKQPNAETTKQEAATAKKSRSTKRAKSVKEPKEGEEPKEVSKGRKSKSTTDATTKDEAATETVESAPKPKTRRRRTAKPKGEQTQQSTEQTGESASSSNDSDTTTQTADNQQ